VTDQEQTRSQPGGPSIDIQATAQEAHERQKYAPATRESVFELIEVTVAYDGKPAVADVTMDI
jgi:hypothetical protein